MSDPGEAASGYADDPLDRACLVFGLGNPGPRYRFTRHNLGFLLIDVLEHRWRLQAEAAGGDYVRSRTRVDGRRVTLVRPLTYMNRSGRAVRQALGDANDRRGGTVGAGEDEAGTRARILVAVDDVALPLGRLRLRPRGSSGGHNGLRSVEETLGTECYPRLRMGCGPAPEGADLADYVLAEFDEEEEEAVEEMLERAADAVQHWVLEGTDKTMGRFNA